MRCGPGRAHETRPAVTASGFDRLGGSLRAALRAGPRRMAHRVWRLVQSRMVDAILGRWLYRPSPTVGYWDAADGDAAAALHAMAQLRQQGAISRGWNRGASELSLVRQHAISMVPPVDWTHRHAEEALVATRLHEWDWAWGALAESRYGLMRDLALDWISTCTIGRGTAWQPYPLSRRLVVWSTLVALGWRDEALIESIEQQAGFLRAHLERDLENNHLIANLKALAWVALLSADRGEADGRVDAALDSFWRAFIRQVRADGGHFENTSSYHAAVLLDGLEVARLCDALGIAVSESARETLGSMVTYMTHLTHNDGAAPLLGDSIVDEPVPMTLLAASCDGQALPAAQGSQLFPKSGLASLRAGQTHLVFDCGDLGPRHCPGHGHADALSIVLWSQGRERIVDPGTYQYASGEWRDWFRGTAAHATAMVDGEDQSQFVGPFRVGRMSRTRIICDEVSGKRRVVAEHDGYRRLRDGVIHRREVTLPDEHRVHLVDRFVGQGEHDVAVRFPLAPGAVSVGDKNASVRYDDGVSMTVRWDGSGWQAALEEGWLSREWYTKQPIPVLCIRWRGAVPCCLETCLEIKS